MDPTATLKAFLEACTENDREAAEESLCNLKQWIDRGGFLPKIQQSDGETFRIPWEPVRP